MNSLKVPAKLLGKVESYCEQHDISYNYRDMQQLMDNEPKIDLIFDNPQDLKKVRKGCGL